MRSRKRTDWPVVVYRYWVGLESTTWNTLPPRAQQEAEAMRLLWNQFVDAFAQPHALIAPHATLSEACLGRPEALALASSPHRQLRHSFFDSLRQLNLDSPVTWANKQFVLTQFQAAVTRFYKKQNRPPRRKLGPIEEVHFHHRFTSGGLPVERLFGRGQRVHLEPVSPEAFDSRRPQRQRKRLARTSGSFLVGDAPLAFRVILHRPLPQGAYVKAATLIGRQEAKRPAGWNFSDAYVAAAPWRWSLHLTLETPPLAAPLREQSASLAALQVSCHFVGEEQLRIAMLTDASGREEAVMLPTAILRAWRYKRTLQSKAHQLLLETLSQLRETPHLERLSQAVRLSLAHVASIRTPGLWRLASLLEGENPHGIARTILRHWADRSIRLLREMRGLEQHYLSHRDWFYRNTALQLCQRYQQFVLTSTSAKASDTAYQLAAPGRFLTFFLQAAKKTNTEVHMQNDPTTPGEDKQQSRAGLEVEEVKLSQIAKGRL